MGCALGSWYSRGDPLRSPWGGEAYLDARGALRGPLAAALLDLFGDNDATEGEESEEAGEGIDAALDIEKEDRAQAVSQRSGQKHAYHHQESLDGAEGAKDATTQFVYCRALQERIARDHRAGKRNTDQHEKDHDGEYARNE